MSTETSRKYVQYDIYTGGWSGKNIRRQNMILPLLQEESIGVHQSPSEDECKPVVIRINDFSREIVQQFFDTYELTN